MRHVEADLEGPGQENDQQRPAEIVGAGAVAPGQDLRAGQEYIDDADGADDVDSEEVDNLLLTAQDPPVNLPSARGRV